MYKQVETKRMGKKLAAPGSAACCSGDDAGQYAFVAKSVSVETMQVNFLSLSDNIAWKEE